MFPTIANEAQEVVVVKSSDLGNIQTQIFKWPFNVKFYLTDFYTA